MHLSHDALAARVSYLEHLIADMAERLEYAADCASVKVCPAPEWAIESLAQVQRVRLACPLTE